jgi:Ca-activated chloride channel homolog
MRFIWPTLLGALVLVPVMVAGYVVLQRRRAAAAGALGASGLVVTGSARRAGWRRHVPFAVLMAALTVLLFALARPEATLASSRPTGTVLLVIDVSNSMGATDVQPTRLAQAQAAAREFVEAQPSTIEIGIVAFGNGALVTQQPTNSHTDVIASIERLKSGGATSLGQGMLAGLGAITGKPVALPDPDSTTPAPPLGFFPSATMVLLSDGEDTGGPDPLDVARLAATAGVHVSTIGFGTTAGTVIDADGYQVSTALDEQALTDIADTTGGHYAPAAQAGDLDQITRAIDLRVTTVRKTTEITAAFALAAIGLLFGGGVLMLRWFGRVV